MAGTPVKLTFDLSYPDHAQAYDILRRQKHTTQFVVGCILAAAGIPADTLPPRVQGETSNQQVTEVTAKLPDSYPQDTRKDKTRLEDVPKELLEFLE